MEGRRKWKNVKESAETGNDANDVATTEPIKNIFQETFKQQEQVSFETVIFASTLTNIRIEKVSADITKKNEKIVNYPKRILMFK